MYNIILTYSCFLINCGLWNMTTHTIFYAVGLQMDYLSWWIAQRHPKTAYPVPKNWLILHLGVMFITMDGQAILHQLVTIGNIWELWNTVNMAL